MELDAAWNPSDSMIQERIQAWVAEKMQEIEAIVNDDDLRDSGYGGNLGDMDRWLRACGVLQWSPEYDIEQVIFPDRKSKLLYIFAESMRLMMKFRYPFLL